MIRNFDKDYFYEKKQEELDDDLIGHLASDDEAFKRFTEYLANTVDRLEASMVDKLIQAWIKTPDGKRWYEDCFNSLTEMPERDDDDDR